MKKQFDLPNSNGVGGKLNRLFSTERFWYIVLGFFVFCSAWIAVTSLYPMAFDEQVHFGTIKAYSEVWSPFSLNQKTEYDSFGAITTDPSYLYHYLMSFPYRFIKLFITSQPVTVVLLRFLNIGIFVIALFVFRKVLFAAKLSRSMANVVLAVFVLIPVVPLLAGQINYDNLVILMTALLLLFVLRFRTNLRAKNGLFFVPLLLAFNIAILGSIVKYAFLPIAVGAAVYVLIEIFLAFRRDGKRIFDRFILDLRKTSSRSELDSGELKPILSGGEVPEGTSTTEKSVLAGRNSSDEAGILSKSSMRSMSAASKPIVVSLVILTVLSFGLFAQRYVVNVVRYGAPVPDCSKVLSVERCMAYGPWRRNYNMAHRSSKQNLRSLPHYTTTHFAWGMWNRLYFTLAGPSNNYATRVGLVIPSYTAVMLVLFGSILILIYGKSIFKEHPEFWLFILVSVTYISMLLGQVYGDYLETGYPVAINGRYLLPLLPGLGAIFVVAYSKFIPHKFEGFFAVVVLLLLLQGGGSITYMVSSEPSWFWPNRVVQNATNSARNVLSPFTIGE